MTSEIGRDHKAASEVTRLVEGRVLQEEKGENDVNKFHKFYK